MADLIEALPDFKQEPWRFLLFSMEKKRIMTAELIALDPLEIARKCPLPPQNVKQLAAIVAKELKFDVGYGRPPPKLKDDEDAPPRKKVKMEVKQQTSSKELRFVKTLDNNIDECLGGGFPAGYISEIVGESAVGKTQFVLSLLLSAQLRPPQGLGKRVIYLSTEAGLNTKRLEQILAAHADYQGLPSDELPSMDRILTMHTKDFEQQEHIIRFQIPVAVRRYDVGMVVIDSIAANFRTQFQGVARKVLAERAVALNKIGVALRKVARDHNVAVVVTNQVSDRFDDARTAADKLRLSSQTQSPSSSTPSTQQPQQQQVTTPQTGKTSMPPPPYPLPPGNTPPSSAAARRDEVMSLDYQQRFFTGWGDDPSICPFVSLKTPALGLTWAHQLDARIVLKMGNEHTRPDSESSLWSDVKRKRTLAVVFAPWVAPTQVPVKYELTMEGPASIVKDGKSFKSTQVEDFDDDKEEEETEDEGDELLDPRYWEDDEFP